MASNDYYNQKPHPDAGYYTGHPSSSSAFSSPAPTPAPPYSSQPYLAPGDRPSQQHQQQGVTPSPFETVFDDHVYPASTHQPTPTSSMHRLSHQDTGYQGYQGRHSPVSPDDMYNRPGDDIPLQDQAQRVPSKDAEMQDHVYDASASQQPRKQRKGRGVRFGELGMMGSGRKKIPFVVYFFTLVQVGVFIGEIVKNGTFSRALHVCRVTFKYRLATDAVPTQQPKPAPPS